MRRVLFVVLFAAVLLGSVVPAGLAEDLPRHRDPLDFGPEPPNLRSLEGLYGFVFNWTMAEDFPMALSWLDFSGLVFAPEATKAVLGRYEDLFRSEIGDLNLTRSDIEVIKGYLRRLKLDDAKAAVVLALARLDGANVTLASMDLTVAELAAILKGSPQTLLEGDEGLRTLIEKYRGELLGLLEQVENPIMPPDGEFPPDTEFIVTKFLIIVTPLEALVGSSVRIQGNLTDSSDVGLASRVVNVFVDNDIVESVVTDGSGSLDVEIAIPYVYKDHVTVSAGYLGDIIGNRVYLPCSSEDVPVKLVYYTPVISVELPRTVYPGKSFMVSGSVSVDGLGVGGLGLDVSVFSSVIRLVSNSTGGFSVLVSVPEGSPEGLIGVGVYSSPREVIGPSSFVRFVDVARIPLTLSVDSSSWAVSGFPFSVSGSILLEGVPVGNCTVRLGGSVGESVVVTGADGRFESEIGLPFSLFTADYPYSVRAYASEAWVSDSSAGGKVFVVNVASLVALPLMVGGVVYYGSRWLRRPRRRVAAPLPMDDGAVPVSVPAAVAEAEGGPVSVRAAYGSALELVVERSGVSPEPSMTLREYLGATKGRLGAGERVFRSLTLMFERWLYGGSEVKLGIVDRLLLRLRKLFS